MPNDPFRQYLKRVEADLLSGDATEHTHRPALQTLIESTFQNILATNEPKHIDCGAPDYVVSRVTGKVRTPIGYIEAKDVGTSLSSAGRTKQLRRYRDALPNLILTDYLNFRWYVDGDERMTAHLAHRTNGGKLQRDKDGARKVRELLEMFLAQGVVEITKPAELASRLARYTHIIRDVVVEAFSTNNASVLLRDLHRAFEGTLTPDLKHEQFADMYAQTLAYGLFAARIAHQGTPDSFHRRDAAAEIPKTNPFLRRLFDAITGVQLDAEPYVGFVDDIAQLLAHTDIEEILAEFGRRERGQDPIIHFYETFLAAYDPKLRKVRGVYYTPEPVVSYIVRSVDWLLKENLGIKDGLASSETITYATTGEDGDAVEKTAPKVLILDPACGTGTFLYAVVDLIREQFMQQNNAGMWPGFVKQHLLPRLFGFELLMAPYAVAHLKLGMQLAAQDMTPEQRKTWAYEPSDDERINVYLTNTLDEARKRSELLFAQFIADEANAAVSVKTDKPVLVVVGNPPWAGHSANASWREVSQVSYRKPPKMRQTRKTARKSPRAVRRRVRTWIGNLLQSYYEVDGKPLGERNPKWLQDDYVKFIRFGQWRIERTGSGILVFITNHNYLDGPTFRGMRQHLLDTFTDIFIIDLHGNERKGERTPDGGPDKNVFDIQQGNAIGIFVKEAGKGHPARVRHVDVWGLRQEKYEWLSTEHAGSNDYWSDLRPAAPSYLFVPQDTALRSEYEAGSKATDIFPAKSLGIITARDSLTIQWSRQKAYQVAKEFAKLSERKAREQFALGPDARDWKVALAQSDITSSGLRDDLVVPILYRPFDVRFTYYTGRTRGFICMPRRNIMRHMFAASNLGMVLCRQVTRGAWTHVLGANAATDDSYVSNVTRERGSLLPLYLYPESGSEPQAGDIVSPWPAGPDGRRPNLSPKFAEAFAAKLKLTFAPDGVGDLKKTFGPEDIFHYIYSVLHSPAYRSRYAEFLKRDFPRIPLTSDTDIFRALVKLGAELTALHLMESPALDSPITTYPAPGNNTVVKGHPTYLAPGEPTPGTGKPLERSRVYINEAQYFDGVPPQVWEFYVGGYQVCEKWLKDRRGRTLSFEDLTHYQKIVVALNETIRLMQEIDEVIQVHGGWPGAFQVEDK